MLLSIENLLKALDEHKIIYCHWKSNEHLEKALNGDTDLDMLFEPAQRTKIEYILAKCGLKRFRATPLMQYNAIEDFIGFDQEASKIWHVHAHYRMTLGEKHLKGYTITPWGTTILKDRVKDKSEVWISEASEELVLLFCRIALKLRWRDLGRNLSKDERAEITWLLEQTTKNSIEKAGRKLVSEKTAKIIDDLMDVTLERKVQFKSLQKNLRKELKPFTSYSKISSCIIREKREIFWLFGGFRRRFGINNFTANRRVSPSGGLVAAILGCDGAGKSTTLAYVRKEFAKKLDVVSIYYGSGEGSCSLLRRPMKLIAQKVGGKGVGRSVEKEYEENKKVSLKSRLYSCAKIIWAVTLVREKKKKQYQMVKARNQGLLVLTDRYPQSKIDGAGDGPLLSRYRAGKGILKRIADWEQCVYESFAYYPPDLAIKLVVPTDVAVARKPEMTAEEIKRKKAIVMSIDISEHTSVIDTSRPFEITRGEVMKEIWDLI